ncbi:MAG: anti-sigma factor antagonist [Defluviitaleaceae bacterium]|nr:anti-sigma factor antagonist [Defluviitaleaceae bacterium]
MSLGVITLEKNKCMIVKITGDIDHHTSEEIRLDVDRAYDRSGCRHIIFDFSGVGFMDSSGVGMVIGRYKNAVKKNGKVAIANMNRDLSRIYEITGLGKIIGGFKTLDEAERTLNG